MVSVVVHFLVMLIGVVGTFLEYNSWKRSHFKSDASKWLFLGLLFFALYHFFLSVPIIVFGLNSLVLAYGYSVAIVFLFLSFYFIVIKF